MNVTERAQIAERNANIVRAYESGIMNMPRLAGFYGISKARVSQIIKAERLREQRERCARGEHGGLIEREYEAWFPDGMRLVRSFRCDRCGAEVER